MKSRATPPQIHDLLNTSPPLTIKPLRKNNKSYEDDDRMYHSYSDRKLRQSIGKTMVELSSREQPKRPSSAMSASIISLQGPTLASTGQFMMDSMQSTKGFKTQEEAKMEDEYIKSLQKQIGLLSTELQLQRKANDDTEKKLHEKTEPIEDPILTIKKKFAEKDENYNQFIEKFKQEIADRESKIVKLKEKYKKWKDKNLKERDQSKLEVRSLHEKYVPEVVKLEKQIDMLNIRIKQELKENDRKNGDIKGFLKEIGEISKKVEYIQMQKDQAEKQLQPLMDELNIVKKELLNYNSNRDKDKNEIESLKGRLSKYEKEWEDALHNLKKKDLETKQLQLDNELVVTERDKLKEQVKTLKEKNNEQETQIAKLQTKLNETQWDLTRVKVNYENLFKEKTNQEKENDKAQTEYKDNKIKYDEMRRQFKEIQEKLQKKDEELKSFLHTQFEALKLKNGQLEESLKEIAKQNEEIRIDNKNIQEENDSFHRNNKLLEDEKEQYEKNEIQRKILIKKLKNQLKLSLAVQNVDRQNLSTLMNSNVNVAQSIRQLMDIMKESKDILAEEHEVEAKVTSSKPKTQDSFETWVNNKKR